MNQIPTDGPLEISGAVDPSCRLALAIIQEVLNGDDQALSHGAQFTGRPATSIRVSERAVLKWHQEPSLAPEAARRWISERLESERNVGIYHPAKTWGLIDGGERAWIFNVMPRLEPVHTGLGVLNLNQRLELLQRIMTRYVQVASYHRQRLDEGLSNFATDSLNNLYYLDDDRYQWDDFLSFAHGVGVWLRLLDWLEEDSCRRLGSHLRRLVHDHFPDEGSMQLREHFQGLFMAPGKQQKRLQGLMDGLERGAALPKTVRHSAKRLAILADIHANYPALEAVLAALDDMGVEEGIVLGDTVGYGPHPQRCIDLLRQRKLQVIRGNHDQAVVAGIPELGFSKLARWVLEWSMNRLDDEARAWLGALPLFLEDGGWYAVHGAPLDPNYFCAYVYQMTFEDNLDFMAERRMPLCFHGHSHVQGAYCRQGSNDGLVQETQLVLADVDIALVCPGSVGQPRNRMPGAEFAIYDMGHGTIDFYRIGYAMEKTLIDMADQGFPERLIERLKVGE